MPDSPNKDTKWEHPRNVLKFQKLKLKKKALQERISGNLPTKRSENSISVKTAFQDIFDGKKRKNPFLKEQNDSKKAKSEEPMLDISTDQTLFKLLNQTPSNASNNGLTSFSNIVTHIKDNDYVERKVSVRITGEPWCPIDWTLKRKIRLISLKPFPWNQKLKISEEASGITSFTRCLDIDESATTLNASPNAKFYQCCLFWQQPFLPWLPLFPRSATKHINAGINLGTSTVVKNSLYQTWTDSFKSLYQLIRTRQCPYFYVCANGFTALFRAAGILGYTDIHVIVTPTTKGFRHMLKQEEVEFSMPLRNKKDDLFGSESVLKDDEALELVDRDAKEFVDEDDTPDEEWLRTMGINAEDIKQINYTQARIEHKTECEVDSSDQSLIMIEGVEVNGFYNFLINCKSAIAPTGTLAGIPPTLLAPVSFHGATLNALKVRENKIHSDGSNFYSLELTGPILPSTLHNLFNINAPDHSMTVTFGDIESTRAFSKVLRKNQRKSEIESRGTTVFSKENLSECGLNAKVLKHFCSADPAIISNIECLKYSGDNQNFTWS